MNRSLRRIAYVSAAVVVAAIFRPTTAQPVGGEHAITLPSIQVDMPDGPGFKAFTERCVVCHSPQYVLNQPRFSKETWTNEVDKMKKTFGAPIADDQVEDIVNYLVSVRGNGK